MTLAMDNIYKILGRSKYSTMSAVPFFYPHAFGLFDSDRCGLEQRILSAPGTANILLWSIEAQRVEDLEHWITFVQQHDLADRVQWLLQPSHYLDPGQAAWFGSRLHLVDTDLLLLDLHVHQHHTSSPNSRWVPDTGKFLFPTGKADRANRIRLLYKFHQAGISSKCVWSLFLDRSSWQRARDLIPELDDQAFDAWTRSCAGAIDDIVVGAGPGGGTHSQGMPFSGDAYGRTSFRVISETQMLDTAVITEKTWITIMNRVPFIMAGYANNLRYLKDQGYRTFENYLPLPGYDSILDQEQRLDAVVTNTRFWLDHIQDQHQHIAQDVEHNYHLLQSHIKHARDLARQLAQALGEPHRSCYALIPLSIEHDNWIRFYYNVKDPAWPECWLPQAFGQLPEPIQRECQCQFGYIPPDKH